MYRLKPYRILFILYCLFCVDGFGQLQIPRDTTYTVWSTHNKLKKQYPKIKTVKPFQLPDVAQRNDITYTTVEYGALSRELKADLFFPKESNQKSPGIILVHGGGWRSGDKSMNTPLAQQLAVNGFIVMSVEYQLSLEAKYPAAVFNLKAAVRWLRSNAQELNLDDKNIAIIGGSAGGQLAALIGATNGNVEFEDIHGSADFSSEIQAVVDLDGLLDFTDPENLAVKRTAQSADVFWLEGHYDSIPEKWKSASALYNVNEKSPPYLFINSSQTRFHAGCKSMEAKLNSLGIKSEVVELKDAPHSYWLFEPWFTPMTESIVLFLNQTLRNK